MIMNVNAQSNAEQTAELPIKKRLTAEQFAKLRELSESGDRTGFYMQYYEYTGCDQALEQAQISSFSDIIGGTAKEANELLKDHPSYHKRGVIGFSEDIQQAVFEAVKKSYNAGEGGIITDLEMVKAAQKEWMELGIGDYFPGNAEVALETLFDDKKMTASVFCNNILANIFSKGTAAGATGAVLHVAHDPFSLISSSAMHSLLESADHLHHPTFDLRAVSFVEKATGKTSYVYKTGIAKSIISDKFAYKLYDNAMDKETLSKLLNIPAEQINELTVETPSVTLHTEAVQSKAFFITLPKSTSSSINQNTHDILNTQNSNAIPCEGLEDSGCMAASSYTTHAYDTTAEHIYQSSEQ